MVPHRPKTVPKPHYSPVNKPPRVQSGPLERPRLFVTCLNLHLLAPLEGNCNCKRNHLT